MALKMKKLVQAASLPAGKSRNEFLKDKVEVIQGTALQPYVTGGSEWPIKSVNLPPSNIMHLWLLLSTIDALAKIEDPSVQAPKVDTIISEPIGRWMQDVHAITQSVRFDTFAA